jgi:glycine/D-amino acid oxidase-like deaminating enzyme
MPWRQERILSPEPSGEKVRFAVTAFHDMFPDIRLDVDRAWAGYTDTTPDALPVIDQPVGCPGLTIATGFSGHGFAVGPIVGKILSDLVVDGETSFDLDAFRLARFTDGSMKKPRLVT